MEQNNDEKKELAKTGAKVAMKAAMAPVKTMIFAAIATILPYLLVGVVIFIVIFCVYLGTLEQIDEVLEDSTNWGERIGNAVSLYGFKTNEELDKDEEGKFFFMLDLYKKVFEFDNYELSLLTQTLLYEGSNEERIYLSEKPENYDEKNDNDDKYDIDNDEVTLKENEDSEDSFSLWSFIKNIVTNYQRGFLTSYAGNSPYLKANKNLLVNAAALKKCQSETNGVRKNEKQCYKGYLVADFNVATDYMIDQGEIESDVEEGYLVLRNDFLGESKAIRNEVADLSNSILGKISGFTILSSITRKFTDFEESMRNSFTLAIYGKLASKDDKHYYYDGYIVNNLKEEYKVTRNDEYDSPFKSLEDLLGIFDKDIVEKEQKNRKETANEIIDAAEVYRDLTYGPDNEGKKDNFDIVTSEKNSMVTVKINGEDVSISFEDYVSLLLLQKYGDSIFDKDKSILEAVTVQARTDAYKNATVNGSSLNYTDNRDFSQAYEVYSNLTSKQKSDLKNALSNTTGKVIKDANGNLNSNFDLNIEVDVDDGKTYEDVINAQGGNVENKNITGSPFPSIDNLRNYLSAIYGYDPTDTVHRQGHGGVDIGLGAGTNVYAASSGKVIASYNSCPYGYLGSNCGPLGYHGFGNIVVVESYDSQGLPYYTYYGHMLAGSVGVNVGDVIESGQNIGQIGSSGDSNGYHLHFEVRYGGNDKLNRVDPLEFYGL